MNIHAIEEINDAPAQRTAFSGDPVKPGPDRRDDVP